MHMPLRFCLILTYFLIFFINTWFYRHARALEVRIQSHEKFRLITVELLELKLFAAAFFTHLHRALPSREASVKELIISQQMR